MAVEVASGEVASWVVRETCDRGSQRDRTGRGRSHLAEQAACSTCGLGASAAPPARTGSASDQARTRPGRRRKGTRTPRVQAQSRSRRADAGHPTLPAGPADQEARSESPERPRHSARYRPGRPPPNPTSGDRSSCPSAPTCTRPGRSAIRPRVPQRPPESRSHPPHHAPSLVGPRTRRPRQLLRGYADRWDVVRSDEQHRAAPRRIWPAPCTAFWAPFPPPRRARHADRTRLKSAPGSPKLAIAWSQRRTASPTDAGDECDAGREGIARPEGADDAATTAVHVTSGSPHLWARSTPRVASRSSCNWIHTT